MAPREKQRLMKQAGRCNMTASDFARTLLVHSDDGFIRIADVEPLRQTLRELARQGTNLDQLIKFLNTNGAHSYDSHSARPGQSPLQGEGGLVKPEVIHPHSGWFTCRGYAHGRLKSLKQCSSARIS